MFGATVEPDCLPGEVWLPMMNPMTGCAIRGREVSSFGRLRSRYGVVTRGHKDCSRYCSARVDQGAQRWTVQVHRLVAYAFLGPPPSSLHSHINHKDLNRSNNCVENLEYVTPSENMQHYYAVGDVQPAASRSIPVLARPFDSDEEWIRYPSMLEAAKILGTSRGKISRCVRGLTKRAGTHEFRRAGSEQLDHLPGEEWRKVDLKVLLEDKMARMA